MVALRETRRGAGRLPPFTVVDGQPAGARTSGHAPRGGKGGTARAHGAAIDASHETAGSTEIADLRGGEIERLLAENVRLNGRIVFLLKVIECEQARSSALTAKLAAMETDRARSSDVKAALEAELRPVLLVLLRLLEKRRADPAANGAGHGELDVAHATAPEAALGDAHWIVDLDAQRS